MLTSMLRQTANARMKKGQANEVAAQFFDGRILFVMILPMSGRAFPFATDGKPGMGSRPD